MSPANKYGFAPDQVDYQLARRDETRASTIMAAVGTFTALATLSVFLRIGVRWRNKNGFKADDHTIFVACILTWGAFVTIYYRTKNGLGMHLSIISPEMFHYFGMAYYVNTIFYIISQMLTQISIQLLYKRVFTFQPKWFRIALAAIAFLALTSNLSTVLAVICQCSPIRKGWNGEETAGHCLDATRLLIAHSALSFLVDVAVVVVPLPLVWKLPTNRRTKAAVTGMVLLGSLVSVVNPIKIYYFAVPLRGDVTYDGQVASSIWAHVQLCLRIVGANLLCLNPHFRSFQGMFSSHHPSASAPTNGAIRPVRTTKGSAPDQYKSLEGKEPSLTESDIGLVRLKQWAGTRSFAGQSSSGHTKSIVEGGFARSTDVEPYLSMNEIGVTRDIDVSSSRA